MRALLSETGLLEGCTSQELEDIEKISQSVTFNNGDVIFTAGSPADHLYIVSKGTVELRFTVTYYLARKEVALDRKHKGGVFGWSTLTRPHFYTSEAVTVEDSELIQLKGEDIKRLQADNIHLGYLLMLGQDAGQRLKDQGTFYVGDLPFTMFVQYRVPENFNGLSMVFMHGAGQNGGMYETTPDGRPGWIFFFLQRGFAVYNVDWPCMGRSAFVAECPSISGTDVINAGVQLLDRIQTPTILLSWSTSGIFVTGMTDPPV